MQTPEYTWQEVKSAVVCAHPPLLVPADLTTESHCSPSDDSHAAMTLLDLTGNHNNAPDTSKSMGCILPNNLQHQQQKLDLKGEDMINAENICPQPGNGSQSYFNPAGFEEPSLKGGGPVASVLQCQSNEVHVAVEQNIPSETCLEADAEYLDTKECEEKLTSLDVQNATQYSPKAAEQEEDCSEQDYATETLAGADCTTATKRRKKPRCLYDERQMVRAVQLVEEGSSIMAAAKQFSIPRATLWCRMKRDYPCAKLQTGPPSALLDDEEEAVCQWVAAMTAIGKPQTFKSLALIVKEVLDSSGRRNVFNNNKPSEGWIGKFKKKHMHLFSKKPEATTLRDNITADDIGKFFHELDYHLQSEGLDPLSFLSAEYAHRVFNMDEAGVYIPNDDCLSKLLMRRSERCNLQGCGDTRQMVTVVSCGNASGDYIRPLLLFKEPRIPFKSGCPGVDNSSFNVGISELGWMDHKAFLHWLQHFEDQLTEIGVEKPVLLLLDGHSPHISVTSLEYAKECGVILHQIPPHTSHLLQPIFLALYKDLKKAYREVVIENWPKDDRVMNKKQFPAIFMEAWKRTIHSGNLVDGFREAGIIPRDSNIVTNKLVIKDEIINSESSFHENSAKPFSNGEESSQSICMSSLQALLSSKTSSSAMVPRADCADFTRGLQDAIDVVKEYIPKQVSEIYEKWIEEQNTICTSDNLYHIWLCLHNKMTKTFGTECDNVGYDSKLLDSSELPAVASTVLSLQTRNVVPNSTSAAAHHYPEVQLRELRADEAVIAKQDTTAVTGSGGTMSDTNNVSSTSAFINTQNVTRQQNFHAGQMASYDGLGTSGGYTGSIDSEGQHNYPENVNNRHLGYPSASVNYDRALPNDGSTIDYGRATMTTDFPRNVNPALFPTTFREQSKHPLDNSSMATSYQQQQKRYRM